VVWFGEGIDPAVMRSSIEALDCDIFFTIGTDLALQGPAEDVLDKLETRGEF
jgi:NAD-dependent SIR2 family protein deacetylase